MLLTVCRVGQPAALPSIGPARTSPGMSASAGFRKGPTTPWFSTAISTGSSSDTIRHGRRRQRVLAGILCRRRGEFAACRQAAPSMTTASMLVVAAATTGRWAAWCSASSASSPFVGSHRQRLGLQHDAGVLYVDARARMARWRARSRRFRRRAGAACTAPAAWPGAGLDHSFATSNTVNTFVETEEGHGVGLPAWRRRRVQVRPGDGPRAANTAGPRSPTRTVTRSARRGQRPPPILSSSGMRTASTCAGPTASTSARFAS